MSLQTPGFRRQSSWVKPAWWDSMSSAACVMMPPCGMHMMVSARARGDGCVSRYWKRKGLLNQGLFKGNETQHQSRGSLSGIRRTKIYFSTDLDMSAKDIIEYYRTRFQIEFCFRDSKQFTGLNDCQARDLKKLNFAFNPNRSLENSAFFLRKMCRSYGKN